MHTPPLMPESESSLSIFSMCRSLLIRTGKSLLCFLGLFVCFILLSSEGETVKKEDPDVHKITLDDSLLTPDSTGLLRLSGKAPSLSQVRLLAQNRELGEYMVVADGGFFADVSVPRFLPYIRIQAYDNEDRKLADFNFKINWKSNFNIPELVSARYFLAEGKLWVNGAVPRDSFTLLAWSPNSVQTVHREFPGAVEKAFQYSLESVESRWDSVSRYSESISPVNGMLDIVIPFHEKSATKLMVGAGPDNVGIPIVTVRRDTLPLDRKIQIQLPKPSDVARLSEYEKKGNAINQGACAALVFKSMARLNYRISLPANHPYAEAIASGQMSQKVLFETLIGHFDDNVMAPEDFSQLKRDLGEQGDSISQFSPAFGIVTGARAGWVDIRGTTSVFIDGKLRLDGQRRGVAGLIPPNRDTVQILLNGQKLPWVDKPLPKLLSDSEAVWLGTTDSTLPRILVGYSGRLLPDSRPKPAGRVSAMDGHPESQKDFFNRFESRIGRTEGNGIWTKVLGLLPFLWTAWIIRRFPKTARRSVTPLLLLTGIFALLSVVDIASGLFSWFIRDSGTDLSTWNGNFNPQQGIQDVVAKFGISNPTNGTMGEAGESTDFADSFWMVFIGVIIFSPLFFKEWVARVGFSEEGSPPSARKRRFLFIAFRRLFKLAGMAALWVAGLILFYAHVEYSQGFSAAHPSHPWVNWLIGKTPLVTAWVFSVPVIRILIKKILPGNVFKSFDGWLGASLAAALPLLSVYLPVHVLLALATAAVFTGLGWTLFFGFDLPALDAWMGREKHRDLWMTVLVFCAGCLIGKPYPGGDFQVLHLSDIRVIIAQLQEIFLFATALAFFGVIWKKSREAPESFLDQDSLKVGGFLFAAVMIGVSTTWMAIPIPFLVACLLVRFALFESPNDLEKLKTVQLSGGEEIRRRVRSALEYFESQSRLQQARGALTQQLVKGELTLEDYQQKNLACQTHFEGKAEGKAEANPAGPEQNPGGTDPVFAVGGPDPRVNALAIFKKGFLLSLVPVGLGLYQYFPSRQVSYPFPWVDFLIHFARGSCYWMLLVLFFAFFYGALRGRTGLTKGVVFSLMMAIPFAVYRIFETQSLQDMRPFLLWAAEMIAFFSLLGLWAGDLRLLWESGFKTKDLRRVHNLPFLSAYASTLLTAIVTAFIAFLSGQMTDFFKFFLQIFMKQGTG